MTLRPMRDHDGNPIDTNLAYSRGGLRQISFSSAAGVSTAGFTTGVKFMELTSPTPCIARFSTSTATVATSAAGIAIPANWPVIARIGASTAGNANTILSVVYHSSASGSGVLSATELNVP
jgi:hypothetical protein